MDDFVLGDRELDVMGVLWELGSGTVAEVREKLPAELAYVARVYSRPRADGTWEGWIEFVAIGAAVVLRTDQETTQSNREDVAYWASGLEPTYIEGAFARARRDTPVVMPD